MSQQLSKTVANLLKDVLKLCSTYDACADVIEKAQERFKGTHLQIRPNIEFALWADFKFEGDWSKFADFVHSSIEDFTGNKSQLWVWKTPNREDINPNVDRILDRIDVALHLLARELSMELPVKTVRNTGYEQRAHLERVLAFSNALSDVIDPQQTKE